MRAAAEILLDVLLHSGFLITELLVLIYAIGERIIVSHPMTKVVGTSSQPTSDAAARLLPIAAFVLIATIALSYVIARAWKLPFGAQVRESALLTLCVAAIHLTFTVFIAQQYYPAALTSQ